MQEFNLESFSDFIKTTLFEVMSVDDYILVIEELFGIRPTKTTSSFITYHSFCHHEYERQGGENLSLKIDTMMFTCYSHCGSMDLLKLVQTRYELINEPKKPYKCMQLICKACGIPFEFEQSNDAQKVINYDWKKDIGRYRKGKKKEIKEDKILDESILNYFQPIYHQSWIDDHITIDVMKKYEIAYYPYLDSATIPCRNINGELIGVRSRLFNPNAEHKYYPTRLLDGTQFNFLTNNHFYGIWNTKNGIIKHKKVLIVESEKGVMQSESYYGEDNFTVGNYGKAFSEIKRNMILSLGVTEVVIGLDFDYDKVGYCDEDNEWIKTEEFEEFEKNIMRIADYFKGYCKVTALVSYSGHKLKDCATDNGKEWYEKLYKDREVIYE